MSGMQYKSRSRTRGRARLERTRVPQIVVTLRPDGKLAIETNLTGEDTLTTLQSAVRIVGEGLASAAAAVPLASPPPPSVVPISAVQAVVPTQQSA